MRRKLSAGAYYFRVVHNVEVCRLFSTTHCQLLAFRGTDLRTILCAMSLNSNLCSLQASIKPFVRSDLVHFISMYNLYVVLREYDAGDRLVCVEIIARKKMTIIFFCLKN